MTSRPRSNGYRECFFKKGAIYNGHFSGARISYLRIGVDPGPDFRLSLLQQRFAVLVNATGSTIAFLGACQPCCFALLGFVLSAT